MKRRRAWENGIPREEVQHEVHEVESEEEVVQSSKAGKIAIGILSSLFLLGAGVGVGYGIYIAELFGPVYNDTDSENVKTIVDAEDESTLFQKSKDGVVEDVTSNYLLKKDTTKYTTNALFKVNSDNEIDTTDVASNYVLKTAVDNDYLKKADTSYGDKLFKATSNVLDTTTDVTSSYVNKPTDYANGNLYKVDSNTLSTTNVNALYFEKPSVSNIGDLYKVETNGKLSNDVKDNYVLVTNPDYANKLFKVGSDGVLDVATDVSSSYTENSTTTTPTVYADGLYKALNGAINPTAVTSQYIDKTSTSYGDKLFKATSNVLDTTNDVTSNYVIKTDVTNYGDKLFKATGGTLDVTNDVTSNYVIKTDVTNYGDKLFKATGGTLDVTNDLTNSYIIKKDTTNYPANALFQVSNANEIVTTNVRDNYLLKTDPSYDDGLFKATNDVLDNTKDVTDEYVKKADVFGNYAFITLPTSKDPQIVDTRVKTPLMILKFTSNNNNESLVLPNDYHAYKGSSLAGSDNDLFGKTIVFDKSNTTTLDLYFVGRLYLDRSRNTANNNTIEYKSNLFIAFKLTITYDSNADTFSTEVDATSFKTIDFRIDGDGRNLTSISASRATSAGITDNDGNSITADANSFTDTDYSALSYDYIQGVTTTASATEPNVFADYNYTLSPTDIIKVAT